jgi:hypothetical protein
LCKALDYWPLVEPLDPELPLLVVVPEVPTPVSELLPLEPEPAALPPLVEPAPLEPEVSFWLPGAVVLGVLGVVGVNGVEGVVVELVMLLPLELLPLLLLY